ncbi:MAG: IclR family transcriptional regulator [Chloroflexi bacterium]|nr:IclR family transcriptional regulator [Chloroflexota bacterium]
MLLTSHIVAPHSTISEIFMARNDSMSVVVPAVEKALDIMEFIAQRGSSATIKELSVHLSIPIATAYRTVRYLCNRRYLTEQSQGTYVIGPQFLHLAHLTTKQSSLHIEAEPVMRKLATLTGQTTQLGILQELGVTYIEQIMPTTPVSIVAALRTVLPVNVSACGKVLIAHLLPYDQEEFLRAADLAANTPNSIVDKALFQQELETVKANGYALDREEYARGIGCCAAPVCDYRGQVIAAVGITGHIADYSSEESLKRLVSYVKSAAEEISRILGGSHPPDDLMD